MEPGEVIVATIGMLLTFGVPTLWFKWWLQRNQTSRAPSLAPATDERMARIEQAVDAIAIEIERISEGQRFTTKLLSDRVALPAEKREA